MHRTHVLFSGNLTAPSIHKISHEDPHLSNVFIGVTLHGTHVGFSNLWLGSKHIDDCLYPRSQFWDVTQGEQVVDIVDKSA